MGFVGYMRVAIILAHEASVRRNHERSEKFLPSLPSSAWSPRAGLQFLILTGNAKGYSRPPGATPAMKTSAGPCDHINGAFLRLIYLLNSLRD